MKLEGNVAQRIEKAGIEVRGMSVNAITE